MPAVSRKPSTRRAGPNRAALDREVTRKIRALVKRPHGSGVLLALQACSSARLCPDKPVQRYALANLYRAILVAQHGLKEAPEMERGLVALSRAVRRRGLTKVYGEMRATARTRHLAPPARDVVCSFAKQGATLALLAR